MRESKHFITLFFTFISPAGPIAIWNLFYKRNLAKEAGNRKTQSTVKHKQHKNLEQFKTGFVTDSDLFKKNSDIFLSTLSLWPS